MERNENGYSLYNVTRDGTSGGCRSGCPRDNTVRGNMNNGSSPISEGSGMMADGGRARLAMAYVPMQSWRLLYEPDYGLTRGTGFEELDLPLEECVND